MVLVEEEDVRDVLVSCCHHPAIKAQVFCWGVIYTQALSKQSHLD